MDQIYARGLSSTSPGPRVEAFRKVYKALRAASRNDSGGQRAGRPRFYDLGRTISGASNDEGAIHATTPVTVTTAANKNAIRFMVPSLVAREHIPGIPDSEYQSLASRLLVPYDREGE
jgi:hypothetical protein